MENLFKLFSIWIVYFSKTTCQNLSPDQEASLKDFIASLMSCKENVCMTISLVRDGSTVFADGFGLRDVETNSSMRGNTKINTGSITKSFTATLAADVVARELADWETPLVDILGQEFRLEGPYRTEQASMRDIFSHKIGMPNYWGVTTAALNISREEMCMNRLQYFTSDHDFRSHYRYTNYGYVLAGYVTEVLTGVTWEDHVRLFLDNLGISETKHAAELDQSDWETNTAYSYREMNGEFEVNPEEDQLQNIIEISPAGGIYTTANDMGLWMLFHLNKGQNEDGDQVIPIEEMNELYSSISAMDISNRIQRPTYPVEDTEYTYGMGFRSGTYIGLEKVIHTGSYSSYNCKMTLLPEVHIGVWACVNSPGDNRGSTAVTLVNMYALDLLLDEEPWLNETTGCTFPSPWEPRVTIEETNTDNNIDILTKDEHTCRQRLLEEYEGEYSHPGFGIFQIYVNETGQLKYKFGRLLQGQLTESEDPLEMNMSLDYPLDYRMAFFPSYPNGFPVYFGTDDSDGSIESIQVPYLEFDLPPVFRRGVLPR